jgi:hypothetical protein
MTTATITTSDAAQYVAEASDVISAAGAQHTAEVALADAAVAKTLALVAWQAAALRARVNPSQELATDADRLATEHVAAATRYSQALAASLDTHHATTTAVTAMCRAFHAIAGESL